MRLLPMFLTAILSISVAFSAETEITRYTLDDLDPAIRGEVERALQEADRARVAYLEALNRANETAKQRIERQVQNATRRGDLDAALASRQIIELLDEGWLKDQVEAEFDLLGNRVVSKEQRMMQFLSNHTFNMRRVSDGWTTNFTFMNNGHVVRAANDPRGAFRDPSWRFESETMTLYVLDGEFVMEGDSFSTMTSIDGSRVISLVE